jgi:hypothetical protein
MIDEIPIIGVTEWAVDGLAACSQGEFRSQKAENSAAKTFVMSFLRVRDCSTRLVFTCGAWSLYQLY